jgi:hypothetical protein
MAADSVPCEDGGVTWDGERCGRRCASDTELECDVPGGGTSLLFHLACDKAGQSALSAKE